MLLIVLFKMFYSEHICQTLDMKTNGFECNFLHAEIYMAFTFTLSELSSLLVNFHSSVRYVHFYPK